MLTLLLALAAAPNVLIIVTDDQGYGDLSCHGNPVVRTPHLDRLHDTSVRLTDFHVAPMCTPTRGQLLTGVDAIENRAMNVSSGRTLLREGLPTLADHLSAAGYRTGCFGKWHLGDNVPFRPIDRGFGEALWFPSSHVGSVPDFWNNDYFDDIYLRSAPSEETRERTRGYCTDLWFDEAARFVSHESEQPFFCYLATNAAHWPHFVPDAYRGPVEKRLTTAEQAGTVPTLKPQKRADLISFLAMIEAIDAAVGRLLPALPDDTLVVFLTDNGSTFGEVYFNAGMRGRKTQLWEGGHRVPCFLNHPSLGKPRGIDGLTHVQDLVPTILDLCDVTPLPMDGRAFDGISLVPHLTGDASPPDRTLFINYSRMPRARRPGEPEAVSIPREEGAGVLRGPWRLIDADDDGKQELYNVASDPAQTTDVAAENPAIVAKLLAARRDWWAAILADGDPAEPERVQIGTSPAPDQITACEWLDVFVDQQQQVRRGDRKTGRWHLKAKLAGPYRIELRRFPDESGLSLTDDIAATPVEDGTLVAGPAWPIAGGTVELSFAGRTQTIPLTEQTGNAITGTVVLPHGDFELQADFLDEAGDWISGAYYVTLEPIDPAETAPADIEPAATEESAP